MFSQGTEKVKKPFTIFSVLAKGEFRIIPQKDHLWIWHDMSQWSPHSIR